MITVVDYGVGNIGAILNMLDYLGIDAQASGDPDVLARADQLILPGVGAFDKAMSTLRSRHLIEPLSCGKRWESRPAGARSGHTQAGTAGPWDS